MIIANAKIVLEDKIVSGSIRVVNENIDLISTADIVPDDGEQIIDANGLYAMPGFIDTHTHGAGGHDFMDGDVSDIISATTTLAKNGTTTCLPTTLTSSDNSLFHFLENLKEFVNKQTHGLYPNSSKVLGAHLEGPYFDMVEKGAQDSRFIKNPTPEHYNKVLDASGGLIKRWSLAPELPGSIPFIDILANNDILVSAAHTAATYDDISIAYDHGLKLLTHFYSGMSSIKRQGGYRILGTIESGYLIDGLFIELICDGIHLPPDLLKMVLKLKDNSKIIGCSDSMRGAGMPDGPSILGPIDNGTACIIEDGIAKLPDRSCFAGSVATGNRLARTLHKTAGLSLVATSRILSLQPAKLLNADSAIGSIKEGKKADLVICNDDIEIDKALINGKLIYNKEI